ncbi:PEGA domain-containing protein [Treponema sp.]|uniref:PEGA domain-containing protein n=1 Tax=Treponema sp. TaxID=166 RepID=UPI00298DB053|nr:PEGA domain-containing protein [Treponema sp.]MCR5614407.1 PEGA domain-containing protein [Treponema sp.]
MKFIKQKKFIATIIFLSIFSGSFLFAESFRVRKTAIINVNPIEVTSGENAVEAVSSTPVTAGINDCICVKLPDDLTFIQGIELNIKIPSPIVKCPNTIIYSVYENISPVPSEKTIDYTGKELYTAVYPGLMNLTIQIPLIKGNTIKKTPYADKTLIPEHSRNFIFIRNQLAMKGVPKDVFDARFIITAKPILLNKGRLVIKTGGKKAENLSIIVDDKTVELDKENSCFLKPGLHNITISADSVRNENRSCVIEVAKTTTLEVDLQGTEPTLTVTMPAGTHVSVDGQSVEVKNNSLMLSPGEHTLHFSLGGYETVKQVNIQEGRSYSINVKLDADFTEN